MRPTRFDTVLKVRLIIFLLDNGDVLFIVVTFAGAWNANKSVLISVVKGTKNLFKYIMMGFCVTIPSENCTRRNEIYRGKCK